MSKKKNRNKQHGSQSQGNGFGRPSLPSLAASRVGLPSAGSYVDRQIEELVSAAESTATELDFEIMVQEPLAVAGSIDELLRKGSEAVKLLKVQMDRLENDQDIFARQAEKLEADRQDLDRRSADLEKVQTQFEIKSRDVHAREEQLLRREEQVLSRELDADAGFFRRNREALERVAEEAADIQKRFSEHRSTMASERADFEKEKLAIRQELTEEIDRSRTLLREEFDAQREMLTRRIREDEAQLEISARGLEEQKAQLRKRQKELELEREMLAEDRDSQDVRVERFAARKVEEKDAKILSLEEQLDSARGERNRLEQLLAGREEADRRFGNQTPDEILRELQHLRKEKKKLLADLGTRPGDEAVARLVELEREREAWGTEKMELLSELADVKQSLNRKLVAVTELESLRNHKAALEASNDLLVKALEEEIRKVQDLVHSKDGKGAFLSCGEVDKNPDYQSPPALNDESLDLKAFSEMVRHRMAHDPLTGKQLYYSAPDVRSFIAGLAMSRLHLLQGISGTGKTSLPLAFARAVGAGSSVVEVQSGWRDRQDLVGHFNAFEGRFHETEFLLSLYQAGSPLYKDRPFIVVLDEMNLSHPEQYFADLLSTLEQDVNRQQLVLMSAAIDVPPKQFKEGRKLPLPPNVWFVGTANHDETTKDFADKTYDRAHVMELPRHHENFQAKDIPLVSPVAFDALLAAFSAAKGKHTKAYQASYEFLEKRLGDRLSQKFRLGWGNRLKRQMESYVPVVIATGGSLGEATDHILATKLLRKIRDRHDNRPEDLMALRDLIRSEWGQLDKANTPEKSLQIIQDELRRLGEGDD